MILVADCMEMGCADTLMRRHREHVKEENKKRKGIKGFKHICTEACHNAERVKHQELHDWHDSQKK